MKFRLIAAVFNVCLITLVTANALAAGPPWEPQTWPGKNHAKWMARHEAYVKRAQEGNIDLLFLGDSITDRFTTVGKDVWDAEYAPLHAADFGITGDRTQYLLWRIENGELDGLSPRAIVLLIGTNNLQTATPAAICTAITRMIADIRAKTPRSRIVLLGLLPRGPADDPLRAKIHDVNTQLAAMDDGAMVRYFDMTQYFVDAQGNLVPGLMSDGLHPSAQGYRVWADAMRPLLRDILKP